MKFHCHHPEIDQEVDRTECTDCDYFQGCDYLPKTKKKTSLSDSNSIDLKKESCRLWVEYLRHSYRYKKLCERLSGYGIDKGEDLNDAKIEELAPDLKEFFDEGNVSRIIRVYRVFGDIFRKNYSFDKWWEWLCAKFGDGQKDGLPKENENHQLLEKKPLVEPLGESIETEIYLTLGMLEASLGRKPTLEEFIDCFVAMTKFAGIEYLKVQLGGNISSLVDEFKKLVTECEKRALAKRVSKLVAKSEREESFMGLHPSIDEEKLQNLRKYLLVYCKREEEEMDWQEIMADPAINDNWRNPNGRKNIRLFQWYRQNGKKIIENAENGIFPGEYPTTSKEEFYRTLSKILKS